MEKIKVKVILDKGVEIPKYETEGSAGMDVRANISEPVALGSLDRALIPTGIRMAIPQGYEVQVRPRSGLALKHGLSMANAIGTIDSDYRGEIGVILINLSKEEYVVQPQERIGQLVLNKVEQMEFEIVDSLDETTRGKGGFGSTGK